MKNICAQIRAAGILPLTAPANAEQGRNMAQALMRGKIPCMEIDFSIANAGQILRCVRGEYVELCVGARAENPAQAEAALEGGAGFIICRGVDEEISGKCKLAGVSLIPICASDGEAKIATARGFSLLGAEGFIPPEDVEVQFLALGCEEEIPTMLSRRSVAACGVDWRSFDGNQLAPQCHKALGLVHGFALAHVGINERSDESALQVAKLLCELLCVEMRDAGKAFFAGEMVEVMKNGGYGRNGHIGFYANNVERAAKYLQRRGIALRSESAVYSPAGRLTFAYLDIEIGGFALHIMQRP